MEYQDCDVSGAACAVNNSPRSRVRSTSLPLISSVNSLSDMYMLSPLLHDDEDDDESQSVISLIPSPKSSSIPSNIIIAENPKSSIPPSSPNQRLRLLCEKYNQSSTCLHNNNNRVPNQPCSLKSLLMDDLHSCTSNISASGHKHCPFHRHSATDLFCVSGTKYSDASFHHSTIGNKSSTSSSPMDDMENSSGCTESEMAHMFFYFVLGIVMVIVQFAKKCFKDNATTSSLSQVISQASTTTLNQTPIIVDEQCSSSANSPSI